MRDGRSARGMRMVCRAVGSERVQGVEWRLARL